MSISSKQCHLAENSHLKNMSTTKLHEGLQAYQTFSCKHETQGTFEKYLTDLIISSLKMSNDKTLNKIC